jgi:predicted GNAT family N-acyltransferase
MFNGNYNKGAKVMELNGFSAVRLGLYGPEHSAPHPKSGRVWLRPATIADVPFLHSLTVSEISIGPQRAMRDVLARNPDSMWVIEHAARKGATPEIAGYYSFLPLTADGLEALSKATLKRSDPPLEMIAPAGTRPAAMYVWVVVAHGLTRAVNPLAMNALAGPYLDVPFYALSITQKGLNAARRRGFVPLNSDTGDYGALAILPMRPPQNEAEREHRLEAVVASNAEHMNMIAFLRGATFGAEQNCPYREEYDDNDYCATHVIGLVDDEPGAVIRIRYFGTFAKLERLAVLARFRQTKIKNEVMEAAIEICRRKGYVKLYGQSQERLVGFYAKFGFRVMQKNQQLVFSDHAYVEIEADLAPHSEPITVLSDPYLIIRPEGKWASAGVLERSAIRPATNPH